MLFARIAFSLVWAIAGLYLLKVTWVLLRRRRDLIERGIVVDGVILDFKTKNSTGRRSGTTTYYMPVVEFRMPNGAPVRFTSSTGFGVNPFEVGQHVPVRYLPGAPDDAQLDQESTAIWTIVVVVVSMVVSFAVASLPIILPPPTPH
jgi:hypothetical protein